MQRYLPHSRRIRSQFNAYGNGELASSVWVQKEGIFFYLSRTDALTELDRTIKLGMVKIALNPNPFIENCNFKQELQVESGIIQISTDGYVLKTLFP